jgi:thiamine-phosphate pyrophosphorylase
MTKRALMSAIDNPIASLSLQSTRNPLYLICDGQVCRARRVAPLDFISAALTAGVSVIQYRDKVLTSAEYENAVVAMKPIFEQYAAQLVVNDHADIAQKHALIAHLGQSDLLPSTLSVPYGRSTHNLSELGVALEGKPPPSYIALGTMFKSPTKPGVSSALEIFPEVAAATQLPLVLIGGITLDNVGKLPREKRIWYAVISDSFRYGNTSSGVAKYCRDFPSAAGGKV